MKKITEADLILYLYKECSSSLATAIDQALEADNIELKEKLQLLRRSIRQLDKLKLKPPSKLSVKAILRYAKESHDKKNQMR